LHKSFGDHTVVNGVDLEVRGGETLAVLGRSGTGKSVLLKLIIGLQKPDSGSIHIHGQDIIELPFEQLNEIRMKVGFLFQEAALYDSLSVAENVAFPLKHFTQTSETDHTDRVRELLSVVGMEEDANKLPSQISGGTKKRVGLARALALEPGILLFDEPTAGLDPITASEIEELILRLKQERTLASVVVTRPARRQERVRPSGPPPRGQHPDRRDLRRSETQRRPVRVAVPARRVLGGIMSRAYRLGLFIVGTLAILAAGVFLIGDRQFLSSSTYPLKTTLKTVGG
jgi:phospholipid/cholesterol/gamma-HCH transport system ATP-binding protein